MNKVGLEHVAHAFANFAVQYNFVAISPALLVMSSGICTLATSDQYLCDQGKQEAWVYSATSAVAFVGSIAGMILFGCLADIIGRRSAFMLTLTLATISICLQTLAYGDNPSFIYATLTFFRFFVGVGLGGIYPCSSVKASESTHSQPQQPHSSSSSSSSTSSSIVQQQQQQQQQQVGQEDDDSNTAINSLASAKAFFWQVCFCILGSCSFSCSFSSRSCRL